VKNVKRTIVSQYANSPTMRRLIENMDAYIDPRADIDAFYSYVWNVETAQGFGLDIWGRIVGIGRYLQIPAPGMYFGFRGMTDAATPFGQAPFYGGTNATDSYALSDDAYRTLILAKALSNISAATAPAMNQLLRNVFPGVRCYVSDLGNMMMRYTFETVLTPLQFAIVTQSGIMLRPAGVYCTMIATALPVFGFKGMTDAAVPFGQAPFVSQGATHAIV
jgi:hypothetical protein